MIRGDGEEDGIGMQWNRNARRWRREEVVTPLNTRAAPSRARPTARPAGRARCLASFPPLILPPRTRRPGLFAEKFRGRGHRAMELCARLSLLRVLFGATDRRAISFAGSGAAWRGGGVRVDRWSLVWPCQFATVSCRADADRRQCLARVEAPVCWHGIQKCYRLEFFCWLDNGKVGHDLCARGRRAFV